MRSIVLGSAMTLFASLFICAVTNTAPTWLVPTAGDCELLIRDQGDGEFEPDCTAVDCEDGNGDPYGTCALYDTATMSDTWYWWDCSAGRQLDKLDSALRWRGVTSPGH